MWDPILYSWRDGIRNAAYGYDQSSCEIMPSGEPTPRCGNVFVSVHEGNVRNDMMNALNEYFDPSITLTMRVLIPLDRVGNALLASQLARSPGPKGQPSFNARVQLLKVFLHMNWGLLQDANTNLANMLADGNPVYGFCEPAHFASSEIPVLVGGEWFTASPESQDVGLKAEIRFEGCRRLQAIGTYQ